MYFFTPKVLLKDQKMLNLRKWQTRRTIVPRCRGWLCTGILSAINSIRSAQVQVSRKFHGLVPAKARDVNEGGGAQCVELKLRWQFCVNFDNK